MEKKTEKCYGVFERSPYLKEKTALTHLDDFKHIQEAIHTALKDYPDFDGIDFCDVSANGIQIRGFHKQVNGWAFGDSVTLNYDFSNIEECIANFIKMWQKYDTEEWIKGTKSFIEFGKKYGWD